MPVSRLKSTLAAAALVAFTSMLAAPTRADDAAPAPDKSQYNLFNPVPDDLMRPFATDRPTKGYTPYTVDAGHVQYEADIVNWTYDHYNAAHVTTSNFIVADPTFKLGLTQNSDLELALAPINFLQTHDRIADTNNTASGFGDVYARVKFNLIGNDGGDVALALVPYVKAPSAAHNVGNGQWEGGIYAPLNVALPGDWTLGVNSELDILQNAALNGDHANEQNLINLTHSLFFDNLTGTAEFWSDVSQDQNAATQYTVDFALAWTPKDNLQFDAGINLGVNKAAPDMQPYIGISQRF